MIDYKQISKKAVFWVVRYSIKLGGAVIAILSSNNRRFSNRRRKDGVNES